MIDKYFEWNIDGIQANTVLENARISVPIDENNYNDIFINRSLIDKINYCRSYFANFFYSNNSNLNKSILDEIHLCYMPKDGMYYIGYNYKEMFTNLLLKLGVDKEIIDEMDLPDSITNSEESHKFINEIERTIIKDQNNKNEFPFEVTDEHLDKYYLLDKLSTNIIPIMKNLISTEYAIKKAVDAQLEEEMTLRTNHKSLNKLKNKNISWKNFMYYTSVKSLLQFVKTEDMNYYRYAKNYYKNVSTNRGCEKPKAMNIDRNYYDCNHDSFNQWFDAVRSYNFPEILVKLDIEDKDTVTVRKTLKNGKGMRGKITGKSKKQKLDFSKVYETLERKITFYKGLSGKVQGIIDGFETDTDYIGYVLDNNYVVFDKFYEISKDGTKVNPAYGHRVYIVTLDVLEACDRDRSKIRKYIRENHDYKAFNYNHTDTDSYQERIKEVLDYKDISITKFKELKLKLK
jgi:hypothetical protein